MLNYFVTPTDAIALPLSFPSPFVAEPHPLCRLAAEELQQYIGQQADWKTELQQGKMFGVLVVKTSSGQLGYLAAFSGNIAGKNHYPRFVPPIYDLLNPAGYFKIEEQEITSVNQKIEAIERSADYQDACAQYRICTKATNCRLTEAKAILKRLKQQRDLLRQNSSDPSLMDSLQRKSQHEKADFKRLERQLNAVLNEKKVILDGFEAQLLELKELRKTLSATLQMKIFNSFMMLNGKGETVGLPAIFASTPQKTPPAGAGECAGPKLLQYAFANRLQPICMAEFWWGSSPKTEVRHHGHFYPACRGKCEPILGFMLQGLIVDVVDYQHNRYINQPLPVVYEDEWLLVVNKPEGMLSVPGKRDADSVLLRMKGLYPQATGPLLVHRLDMATSGLLLIAKTKTVHQNLQAQFKNRTVKKRYIALLNGIVEADAGIVDLPLCPDILDRPRQMVSYEWGKPAITRWEVVERCGTQTRMAFYPLTGRTHQLRVHAAHVQGLHCAIVGDALYGTKADRLYLHAEGIGFVHPVTGEETSLAVTTPF